MAVKPNQLTRWPLPFSEIDFYTYHNAVSEHGVLGFSLRQPDGVAESACLLVSQREYTQRVMYKLFQDGKLYEPFTTAVALGALRQGDIAIDVGAHVGYFSTIFRLCVGNRGSIFSFEPMPDAFRRLLQNIIGNNFNNVMALPLALSDESGQATFYIDPDNEGESSLMIRPGQQSCVVQVTCLDDLFQNFLTQRPRVMKLDAEGVELKILRGGGESFFKTHAPDLVICEYNIGALKQAGVTETELRAFFEVRGYRCGVINNGHGLDMEGATFYRMVGPGEPLLANEHQYVFNLMFVREESGLYPEKKV